MIACVQMPIRKFPERLPSAWAYLMKLFFFPLCVYLSIHRRLSLERHQLPTDFDPGGIYRGPLFAPPSTSARVQSRFGFVELGGDMCSNYQGDIQAGTGITGWCQIVPRTIYVLVYMVCRGTRFTCSIRVNIRMRTYPL